MLAKPGFWNDIDMLEIGNGGMTESESVAHFALWCAFKAPLLLGNDIRDMTDFTLNLLTHDELLAIHRDPLGRSVEQVYEGEAVDGSAGYQVVSKRCDRSDSNQVWLYNKANKSLKSARNHKCLTVGWRNYTYVQDCKDNDTAQQWEINFSTRQIHNTVYACFTTSPVMNTGGQSQGVRPQTTYARLSWKEPTIHGLE